MRLGITLVLIVFSCLASAQQARWQWINRAGGVGSHGTITPDDRAYDMALDQYGNVYVCGTIYDSFFATFDTLSVKTYGEEDLFIAKYSCEGELLWVKVGGNRQGGDFARSISVDTLRKVVYVTGNIRSTNIDHFSFDTDTTLLTGHNDFFLMQLSYEGELNRLFVGQASSAGLYHDLDSAGNVYGLFSIASTPQGPFAPGYNLNSGYHLIKFDPQGNIVFVDSIWDRGLVTLTDIAVDMAGNSYITGYFEDTIVIGGQMLISVGFYDSFLMKYDNQGNFKWIKRTVSDVPSTFQFAYFYSVDISQDGKKVFVGGYGSNGTKISNYTINNTLGPHTSSFLCSYDSDGALNWVKNSSSSQSGCVSWGVSVSDKNEVFLSGMISGNTTFNGIDFFTSEGQNDISVVRFNDNGNVLSHHVIQGGGDVDFGYAVEAGYNGNFHVAGCFGYSLKIPGDTLYATGGVSDIFIARYGIEECLDTTTVDTSDTTGIFENLSKSFKYLKLYPNPSTGNFTITIEQNVSDGQLRIINTLGQQVYSSTLTSKSQHNLQLGFSEGLYFVILETKGVQYIQKLVVNTQ